ncbi:MAG: hypothetical protein KDK08_05290 [Rhizobiaceae bacterium]|nr:hypothetical protein [Rhizobiaceae bacterium]
MNPLFDSKFDELINEICSCHTKAVEAARTTSVVVGDFYDHLRFENEKMKLALGKLQWKDRLKPAEKREEDRLKQAIGQIDALMQNLPPSGASASADFLDQLITAITLLFPERAADLAVPEVKTPAMAPTD